MQTKRFYSSLNWFVYPIIIALVMVGAVLLARPESSGRAAGNGATIMVNSLDDNLKNDGFCTLREAVISANKDQPSGSKPGECVAGSGADTIEIPLIEGNGTYLLTRTDNGKEDSSSTGDLDILDDVAVQAVDPGIVILGENGFTDRIFHVLGGRVTIKDVMIGGGNVREDGGGIFNAATLILTQSTVISNTAGLDGGGIYNTGTLTVTNSTLSGNTAVDAGGGLSNDGSAYLNNVTVANNSASSSGGLAGTDGGTLSVGNSIVALNEDGNCSQSPGITSQGYNLNSSHDCGFTSTGDINDKDPLLGPLQDNGGYTPTYALLAGSPAIDAGNPAAPGSGPNACEPTDQRGDPRPRAFACDIGAFEVQDPVQAGPIFIVTVSADSDDGVCSFYDCSLREAINAANSRPNDGTSLDEIHFSLPGDPPFTIELTSALPVITDPVVIDGTTQTGGQVTLDGASAGTAVDGLVITGGNSVVRGLEIVHFDGNGITLETNGSNLIEGNTIANNGGSGIVVLGGSTDNTFSDNNIYDNVGLPIDLGGDGPTANDPGDADPGPNNFQNYPVLLRANPAGAGLAVDGLLNSLKETEFRIEFFGSETCDLKQNSAQTSIGSKMVTTDTSGNVYFEATGLSAVATGSFVSATATDPSGNTSEFSQCIVVGAANDSWPEALRLGLTGDPATASIKQYLDQSGQSRWYKFTVQPNSQLVVALTGLPANYDLTLYKDIDAAYQDLTSPSSQDLARLGAEFAPAAFSPAAFSPAAFSPAAFSPAAFSPAAFSPAAFSPAAFSPAAFSPAAFSPAAFSPAAFSPAAFSPAAFSPDAISPAAFSPAAFSPAAFSPAAFSPAAFSPAAFSPAAFSSAQTRSLIGVSAFDGNASEGLILNTWNNSGDFYIRVRGREGAFSLDAPFHLDVLLFPGECGQVQPVPPTSDIEVESGGYATIILWDKARMADSYPDSIDALDTELLSFAESVNGVVVNVNDYPNVNSLNVQADTYRGCPYAKNLVAGAIKQIVGEYRQKNPTLQYVVIIGNDDMIPFFRYQDTANLGPESQYVPPVRDNSASQASLRLNYVLGQDEYGAQFNISVKENSIPVPGLPVGRLVEEPGEIITMLNAFESSGGTITPETSLVTGYDFLADAATQIASQFSDGIGVQPDELITPRDLSPQDESDLVWTADDLRAELLGQRHDLVFLAGHFSAVSALAADFSTSILTTDLTSSSVDLTNAIIFSAGCHSGYNIVNQADVPGVTFEPDWAQAFAGKGATLIAGTGYQYGDTDFLEYSERLYLEFAKQLRTGDGPVSVGQALVAAKQAYLATTPQMRGIHEKAYLEATLFGLPMLKVNMPGTHLPQTNETPIVNNPPVFGTDPGHTLGLAAADVTVTPDLIEHTVTLTNPGDLSTVPAFYISGSGSANKVVTNPVEPTLPLEVRNATVPDMVLRGVGFRGGNYTDVKDKLPLLGAPTTEIRGVHAPFLTSIFYPVQPWSVNYYAAVDNGSNGITNLMITPAQFKSDPGSDKGTFRKFDNLNLRLYYSNNTTTYGGNSTPALSDPPTIAKVSSDVDENGVISFSVEVTGNPAAGIQEVWVTYTACDPAGDCNGTWQSTDLVQSANSTLWEGTLTPDASPQDIRFIVQAVNGVGLVSTAANLGFYYVPGVNVAPQPSELTIDTPSDGAYGAQATFTATLASNGAGASGQALSFCLGSMCRQEITGQDGSATAEMPLLVLPGDNTLSVFFGGSPEYQASFASANLTVSKQSTSITLELDSESKYRASDVLLTATLEDGTGRLLSEFTVYYVVSGSGTEYCAPVITDYLGQAVLRNADPSLPVGDYTVDAYFSASPEYPITLCGQEIVLDDQRYDQSSAIGTLSILDQNPVAQDDSYGVNQNEILTIDPLGILSNDSDLDGDPLAVSAVNGNPGDVARQITLASGALLTVSPDGGFTYDPNGKFKYLLLGQTALDSYEYTVTDGQGGAATATVTITVAGTNRPPDCSSAQPINGEWIWPPNNTTLEPVKIDVTDPDRDPVMITITAIWQDEPVGNDSNSPDGFGIGTDTALLRAERDGNGNGRVYHIYFTADDGQGGTCSVSRISPEVHNGVTVGVSDNQGGGIEAIDGGPLYDSTVQSK